MPACAIPTHIHLPFQNTLTEIYHDTMSRLFALMLDQACVPQCSRITARHTWLHRAHVPCLWLRTVHACHTAPDPEQQGDPSTWRTILWAARHAGRARKRAGAGQETMASGHMVAQALLAGFAVPGATVAAAAATDHASTATHPQLLLPVLLLPLPLPQQTWAQPRCSSCS